MQFCSPAVLCRMRYERGAYGSESSEAEIFEPGHFSGLYIPLEQMIAGDTYEHYPDHLNDLLVWMQRNGLD